MSRWIFKARRLTPYVAPSAGEVERERSLWGPHPDPGIAEIEQAFYLVGERFLGRLYRELTADTRPLRKGWGELAKQFGAPAPSPKLAVQGWKGLVDMLTAKLLPNTSIENEAAMWALRAHLYERLGRPVMELSMAELKHEAKLWSPRGKEALEWTEARGMEYLTDCRESMKAQVRKTMLACRQAGETSAQFQQKLFDRFSEQNRDWRRVAITETSFAVNNSKLASVDPGEGWLAEWHGAPKACPYCKRMHGRRFRLVAPEAENKDGDTQILVGKNNVGRSAHKFSKKEQRMRTKAELWWPCLPAHPNCACGLVMVRVPRK